MSSGHLAGLDDPRPDVLARPIRSDTTAARRSSALEYATVQACRRSAIHHPRAGNSITAMHSAISRAAHLADLDPF